MAKRGTTKARSVDQENHIARMYGGIRSKSSGAAANDAGDVRTSVELIECKYTGGPGERKPLPKFIRDLEKVTEEAWQESRDPALALRYFAPESILSGPDGWIDVVVRRVDDDVKRQRV